MALGKLQRQVVVIVDAQPRSVFAEKVCYSAAGRERITHQLLIGYQLRALQRVLEGSLQVWDIPNCRLKRRAIRRDDLA